MDLTRLMQQAQKMQNQLGKIEKELAESNFEGLAGGDGVKVVINGKNEVLNIDIKDELLDKENKEMLQDLLLIAFNNAIKNSNETRDSKMKSVTGGISIPGMF